MKYLTQFLHFDCSTFFAGKVLQTIDCKQWADYTTKEIVGAKITTVIVEEVQGNKLVARALSGVEQEIEKSGDIKIDGDVTVPAEDTATVEIERTTADIENATDTAEIKVPVTETENMTEQKETKRADTKNKPSTKTKKQTTATKSKSSKK